MRPLILRSLWTNGFRLKSALEDIRLGTYDGLEGPVPTDLNERKEFTARVRDAGIPFAAEITTGGGYVPSQGLSILQHLDDFRRKVAIALNCQPVFVTALAGSDSWSITQAVDFVASLLELADEFAIELNLETHRSRVTFHPWATGELLRQLPDLHLTCDFSHWCCVCERLVLDQEPELLALCAERARHFHARIGYEQGPQVPDPRAPEFAVQLAAHQRWWNVLWEARKSSGASTFTMTPEFGPDGYLQQLPFRQTPAGDLDEINAWMANHLRTLFATH